MGDKTRIRWAEASWNPMSGCIQLSPGCDHCYALTFAERMRGSPAYPVGFDPMVRERRLDEPRRWKEPRRIFVNSMSDLHLGAWPTELLDRVYDTMLDVDRHTYMILTKRPRRMRDYLIGKDGRFYDTFSLPAPESYLARRNLSALPAHIWLGATIELDLYTFRADVLREIPVPIRFLSLEPLLGPLPSLDLAGIGWVIVGGESGKGYRPMDHTWARDLRDRARANGIPFFFKQSAAPRTEMGQLLDGQRWEQRPDGAPVAQPTLL